jgi:hypothetical protein
MRRLAISLATIPLVLAACAADAPVAPAADQTPAAVRPALARAPRTPPLADTLILRPPVGPVVELPEPSTD